MLVSNALRIDTRSATASLKQLDAQVTTTDARLTAMGRRLNSFSPRQQQGQTSDLGSSYKQLDSGLITSTRSFEGLGRGIEGVGKKTEAFARDTSRHMDTMGKSWESAGREMQRNLDGISDIIDDLSVQRQRATSDLDRVLLDQKLAVAKGQLRSFARDEARSQLRDAVKDLGSEFENATKKMTGTLTGAAGGGGGFVGGIKQIASNVGPMGGMMAVAIPVVMTLGGALGALVGSLAQAAAGVSVLGVAGAGVFGVGGISGLIGGKLAIGDLSTSLKDYAKYQQAVQQYGSQSKQAQRYAQEARMNLPAGVGMGGLRQLSGFKKSLEQDLRPGIKSITGDVFATLDAWHSVEDRATSDMNDNIRSLSDALRTQFLKQLRSTETQNALHSLSRTFQQIVGPAAHTAMNLLQAFLNTAVAGSPHIVKAFDHMEAWSGQLKSTTGDRTAMTRRVDRWVNSATDWGRMIRAAGRTLWDLFSAGAPAGDAMVKSFTGTLDRWDRWIRQHPGTLRGFFQQAVHDTGSIASIMGSLVGIVGKWARQLEPILRGLSALISALANTGLLGPLAAAGGLAYIMRGGAAGKLAGGAAAGRAGAAGRLGGLGGAARSVLPIAGIMAAVGAATTSGDIADRLQGGLHAATFGLVPAPARRTRATDLLAQWAQRRPTPQQTLARFRTAGQIGGQLPMGATSVYGDRNLPMMVGPPLTLPAGMTAAQAKAIFGTADPGKVGTAARQQYQALLPGARQAQQTILQQFQQGHRFFSLAGMQAVLKQTTQGLPAQMRITAIRSMEAFSSEMEKQGRLPRGSTKKFIAGILAEFPGLATQLHKHGLGSTEALARGLANSRAESKIKRDIQHAGDLFDIIAIDARHAGGNTLKAWHSTMDDLRYLMTHGPKRQREAAKKEYDLLAKDQGLTTQFVSGQSKHRAQDIDDTAKNAKAGLKSLGSQINAVLQSMGTHALAVAGSALATVLSLGTPSKNKKKPLAGLGFARGGRIPRFQAGGRVVTASDYSGGTTASGKIADATVGFAELSNDYQRGVGADFSALGHLPMGTVLQITYNGKTLAVPKIDVGAGGPGLHGHVRAVDLTMPAARALGFSGLADVTIGGPAGMQVGAGVGAGTVPTIKQPTVHGVSKGVWLDIANAALKKATDAANAKIAASAPTTAAGGVPGPPPMTGPAAVQAMISRANEIASHHYNYEWGGGHGAIGVPGHGTGHGSGPGVGFDCSGTVSAVLHAAGLLNTPLTSGGFMSWGQQGLGEHVSIFASPVHVFMVIDGHYFGTSSMNKGGGADWIPHFPESMPSTRHPAGLRRGGRLLRRKSWKDDLDPKDKDRIKRNPWAILPDRGYAVGGRLSLYADDGFQPVERITISGSADGLMLHVKHVHVQNHREKEVQKIILHEFDKATEAIENAHITSPAAMAA